VFEQYVTQYHVVSYKFYMDWPRLNLGLHFERVVTDYLSHSTAILKPGIHVNNVRYNNSVHYKDQLGTVILRNNCCLPFNVV
jgi:hypothetical protein